jgi:hypothetical protein
MTHQVPPFHTCTLQPGPHQVHLSTTWASILALFTSAIFPQPSSGPLEPLTCPPTLPIVQAKPASQPENLTLQVRCVLWLPSTTMTKLSASVWLLECPVVQGVPLLGTVFTPPYSHLLQSLHVLYGPYLVPNLQVSEWTPSQITLPWYLSSAGHQDLLSEVACTKPQSSLLSY